MESRYLFRSRTLPSFPFCRSQPPYPLPPSLLASPIHHWCAASRISSSPHHEYDSVLPPPCSLASSRSRREVLHVAAILFPTIQTTNHTHASSASWRCCIESSFCPKTSVETVTPPWSLTRLADASRSRVLRENLNDSSIPRQMSKAYSYWCKNHVPWF